MSFRNRTEAGRLLAAELADLRGREGLVVLGIPRGGVVVAAEIARELGAALDIWLSKKIGAPGNPEFAIGSVDLQGAMVLNQRVMGMLSVSDEYLRAECEAKKEELRRRLHEYRGDRPPLDLTGRTVVLADDGLATGSTALSAVGSIRLASPKSVILAVPVSPPEVASRLAGEVDRIVVIATPAEFHAVGQFYDDFDQVSDEEVMRLLSNGRRERRGH